MSKPTQVLDALKAAIESVTPANGYEQSVGEVVFGPRVIPDAVNGWPHVQLGHGEIIQEQHAHGRVAAVASYLVAVYCQTDSFAESDRQCSETCGEIQKAVVAFDQSAGQFLGLSYVDYVLAPVINPMELPPEIERGISLWVMTVQVTYHRDKDNP